MNEGLETRSCWYFFTGGSLSLGNVSGLAGVVNVPVVSGAAAGGRVDAIVNSAAQTEMVAAQTRAMSAQSLPPMAHYSGEGSQSCDDSLDSLEKWLEQ